MCIRTSLGLALATVVAATWPLQDARACSMPVYVHELDPTEQELDTLPPSTPTARVLDIRTEGLGRREGCGTVETSCDDINTIRLEVAATDDRTPPDKMGYAFEVVRGRAPDFGFAGAMRAEDGNVTLIWSDGDGSASGSFDFVLAVTAIDLAGNRSAPAEVPLVFNEQGGGCSSAAGAPGGFFLLMALASMAAAARRRK